MVASFGSFSELLESNIDNLFRFGIVAHGVVVSRILFARFKLFLLKYLSMNPSTNFIYAL